MIKMSFLEHFIFICSPSSTEIRWVILLGINENDVRRLLKNPLWKTRFWLIYKRKQKKINISIEMNEFFDLIYKFHDSEKNDYVHFGNYIWKFYVLFGHSYLL